MELRLARFTKVNSPLLAYAKDVTSQFGEDGIIARLVELIQPRERFCVEFGAWDGKYHSNCHELLATSDWQGLMIEGNPEKYRELVHTFTGNDRVGTLNRFVSFEGANSLGAILSECSAPTNLGLLSIDVDGNDYHIWKSLEGYDPEIVVIEFNPTVPNDVFFVQDASFDVNHGCSLLALILLGQDKGYELCVCTTTNAFFVKKEKFGILGIENNFINVLHQPMQDGRIFQGFDGTIHVVGMNSLVWRNIPLSSEDFQVLPKAVRVYRDALKK
jgi:hypothetical protein